jgi:exopolyphosphatase / guanosine-5'-triphosphate,3'-diphosphate pyrophosphatase
MHLAIIDCGTNTFNLIIVKLKDNGNFEMLFQSRRPVKLGKSAYNNNFIGSEAMERGFNAFSAFKKSIDDYQADKVLAFATAAIRDASNGKDFILRIKDLFEINISIIDGEREAELVYLGICQAVKLTDEVSLIMDVGGGSTEFILANNNNMLWKQSFNIGVARLLEKFVKTDPISEKDISNINDYLESELNSLIKITKQHPACELIGSSGAFESILEMIHGELQGEEFTRYKTEYSLRLTDYYAISDRIIKSHLEERKQISSLVSMRQDMIVVFCVVVNFIIAKFNFQKIRVSSYSLKEGVIVDYMRKTKSISQ